MVDPAKLTLNETRQLINLGRSACKAAIAYDKAIQSCSNDPEMMASFCTSQGATLDTLYLDWLEKSRYYLKVWNGLDRGKRGK